MRFCRLLQAPSSSLDYARLPVSLPKPYTKTSTCCIVGHTSYSYRCPIVPNSEHRI